MPETDTTFAWAVLIFDVPSTVIALDAALTLGTGTIAIVNAVSTM